MQRLKSLDKMKTYHKLSLKEKNKIIKRNIDLPRNVPDHLPKDEKAILRFEHMYDKKFELLKKIALKELESILAIPETVSVPAKNIAFEITK